MLDTSKGIRYDTIHLFMLILPNFDNGAWLEQTMNDLLALTHEKISKTHLGFS